MRLNYTRSLILVWIVIAICCYSSYINHKNCELAVFMLILAIIATVINFYRKRE